MAATFTLGLLSKPMLVTLPVLMLLLDYWPLRRFEEVGDGRARRAIVLVVEKLPFVLLSALQAAEIAFLTDWGLAPLSRS